jgi:hypothetical protein
VLDMQWIFASLLVLCSAAATAQTATFYLNDGSTVVGEVRSLDNGIYQIDGASLGRLEIPQEKLRSIQYGGASTTMPDALTGAQPTLDVDALGTSMLANPAIVSILQSLQNDPQFQSVVADPEIRRAINAGDYLSLMANPKILELMNHSLVQAISGEIQP